MSHIDEALKKAQKERDARHLKYNGILSGTKKDRRAFGRRALWLTSLLIIFILLAFTSYSWWDSREKQTSALTEHKRPKIPSRADRTSKPKIAKPQTAPRAKTSRPEPAITKKTSQPRAPVNAKAFYEQARRFHKRGRLGDAKRFYQEALRLDPDHLEALNNLGVICIRDKDYLAAQRSFEKAVRLRPGYVDPYYNLACLHAIKGETEKSLAHLKKAVSLDRSAKDWARKDTDLENLRGLTEFEAIVR